MNYFYIPYLFSTGQILTLASEESHHATRVLRLAAGDTILLLNGLGQKAEARLSDSKGPDVKVEIISILESKERVYKLTIALANLKKRDRIEWFIEKAVELGAAEIIIFSSDHTEKKKADQNRIEKIALSALKQSGNLWMPEIKTDLTFSGMMKDSNTQQKYIAHCEPGEKPFLKNALQDKKDALILIGPEGDFSSREIKEAILNGYIPVSLGELRLRAETAAMAAMVTFQIVNQ